MNKRCYHVTPAKSLAAIAERGLEPRIGPRSAEAGEFEAQVYLFTSLEAVEHALLNWMAEVFEDDERLALLGVELDGAAEADSYECAVTETIKADRLWVLTDDLDSEPSIASLEASRGVRLDQFVRRAAVAPVLRIDD